MAKKAQLDAVRPVLETAEKELDKIEGFLDAVDKIADKGTDVVETGLEKVADVVPDALDTTVHVSTEGGRRLVSFFRDPRKAAVSVVILAGAVGAGLGVAGYFLAVKRLRSKLEKEMALELESEIAEMRRFYETKYKDGKFATPAGAVEELLPADVQTTLRDYRSSADQNEPQPTVQLDGQTEIHIEEEELTTEEREAALRRAGYTDAQIAEVLGSNQLAVDALREKMASGTPIEVTETASNIFVDGRNIEEFDYAAEVDRRSPDEPYVITHDEFMENENGWEQNTLTYFNGDDVLVDDKDIPVPDIEAIVGSENLTKFGYGSRDKNVVYVRNEKLESDYEITLSMGEYAKEVAGFQHSAPLRRFRRSDDE
jgi:hypothetical protein